MSWSKRQIVMQALEEIGIASYVFDVGPDELQSSMRRLDAMVAIWNAQGIQLGYPLVADYLAADLDDTTSFPDWAIEPAVLGLAIRLAPSYGKQISPDLKITNNMAYRAMLMRTAKPAIEFSWPQGTPSGSGHKNWRNYADPFLSTKTETLEESINNELSLGS